MSARDKRHVMATGSNGYPPLLILSNSVYAKRTDGGFYPASVESKDNGNYTVRFPDGRSELVLEDNLIWLGFWGMPPSNWPKNPVIIPTMASWETIGNKSSVVRDNNDPNDQETASFARQRADETRMSNENDEPCGRDLDVWHGLVGGERVAKMPKHVLPRQTDASQSRSSVLRISCSALSKDGNTNDVRNFISSYPDESTKAERLSHSPSDTSQSQRYHKGRPSDFDSNHVSTAQRVSDTTERNGTLKRRASYENPSEKEIHKYSYKRERGVSLSDVDLSDNEEQESQKSSTSSEPESPYKAFTAANASQFIASQFPFLNPACGLTVFAASQNVTIPSSFRLHTGFNKKPEKKKCRKMYGIENRQFWCTQCKWKKACTRFGNEIVPDGIA